ncbi:MAG: M23 family metallopeptidase, partial [Bacteroidota bacterium]
LKSFDVKVGDKIEKGDKIGEVGSTGYSFGPHLHYEVRKNGKAVDPEDYLGLQ